MKLSNLFSDSMVLQRGENSSVFGTAEPGDEIRVRLGRYDSRCVTDSDGNWNCRFESLEPGGPYDMRISCGGEETLIHDVCIGDVFVLSGQSNMELPIARVRVKFEDELKDVCEPYIRKFSVPMKYCFGEQVQVQEDGRWESVSPDTIDGFSAAGYFMAHRLYAEHKIPVGLIQTAIGGTPAEAWMSEESLSSLGYSGIMKQLSEPSYMKDIQEEERKLVGDWYRTLDEKDPGLEERWTECFATDGWDLVELPQTPSGSEWDGYHGSVWLKKTFELDEQDIRNGVLVLGTLVDADQTYINGNLVGRTEYRYPPRRYFVSASCLKTGINEITVRVISTGAPWGFIIDKQYELVLGEKKIDLCGFWKYQKGVKMPRRIDETFFQYKPAALFNGMVYPLRKLAIAAVCFYQGESNTGDKEEYDVLFRQLIADWRKLFGRADLPFAFVQLPNFSDAVMETKNAGWARLREAQRRTLDVPGTAMVTAIDAGEYNDLHPLDKKTIGERLAACINGIYHKSAKIYGGPMIRDAVIEDGENPRLRLYFDSIGTGLVKQEKDKPVTWFEIQLPDESWEPVLAEIDRDTVVLLPDRQKTAVAVRYAWNDNPYGVNLYNKEGFPAVPFYIGPVKKI